MRDSKIITFAHYKGGTGKTTSCINIAGALAKEGHKVLVIDLDPQGNATSGLGINNQKLETHMLHIMDRKELMTSIILKTNFENLHIAPTNHNLSMANIKTYDGKSEALILTNAIKEIKEYYDFILIDTPPSHGHFIINGLIAADEIVMVLDVGVFSLESLSIFNESFFDFFKKLDLNLNISMALVTKSNDTSLPWKRNYGKEIQADVERYLNKPVFTLPYSEDIFISQAAGKPLSHHNPKSKIAKKYKEIAKKLSAEITFL